MTNWNDVETRFYFYNEDAAILFALGINPDTNEPHEYKTAGYFPARIHLEHSWHNVYAVDVLEDQR